MVANGTQLSSTTGLCPSCLNRVPGRYEAKDDAVYLTRTCPDHGESSRQVWGSRDHWEWARQFGPESGPAADADPRSTVDAAVEGDHCEVTGQPPATGSVFDGDCCEGGTCSDDGRLQVEGDHACLAVVEITQDCNLSCSYCFASSGPGGKQRPYEEVIDLLETVLDAGGPRPIQFSGGEPTVHDRLPDLIEEARAMGFGHIEVNTNGIVLANRDGYAERLSGAGATAIYLQFDGVERETYKEIREVDLLDVKYDAIDACRRVDLPVILVPTVVPGVNDDEMGDVVRFALDNLDIVQSVNFQPVAHFGRYAKNDGRFALDDTARRLATQLDTLETKDFLPVPCCSSYCQMGTAVMPNGDGGVLPLTGLIDVDNWDSITELIGEEDWMELLAGTPTGRETAERARNCCGIDVPGAGDVLLVTLTGFMDADAADAERLENCCISVPTPNGELVPFCAYNMTTEDGRYALRNRHGWGGPPSVEAGQGKGTLNSDSARTDGGAFRSAEETHDG